MKSRRFLGFTFLFVSACVIDGCGLPQCHEGEMVCANTQGEQFNIIQSDYCTGAACADEKYEQPCQLYRCTDDAYLPAQNGDCKLGSQIENGTMSCIPLCQDGEIVCGIMDDDNQLVKLQSDSDKEDSVNETPCQRYKCSKNDYVPIENSYCTLGSHIENNVLSCIPQCQDGEIVCAVKNESTGQLEIKQKDSDDEGSVNEEACQKYKCMQNTYDPISNGDCTRGSYIKDSSLSCIPQCDEGAIVCAVRNESTGQLEIKQKDSDDEGSVNEEACQKYKCTQNTYDPMSNGDCTRGSYIKDSTLSCIPQCDEGAIICAVRNESTGQLEIKQKDSDDEGSVNEEACQKYKCTQNTYDPMQNGDCIKGSHVEGGELKCIPKCNEGEIICATGEDSEQLTILQSNAAYGNAVNEDECQLYRCVNDRYNIITNGYCQYGSRLDGANLECRDMCETMPASRCKEEGGNTSLQYCNRNEWVDVACNESCKLDLAGEFSLYSDGNYKSGTCGECKNSMQEYCEESADSSGKVWVTCENGTLTKDKACPIADEELTECGVNKFVDISSDPGNCGGCFHMCSTGETCLDGECGTPTCNDNGYMVLTFNNKKINAYCIHNEADLEKMHDYLINPDSVAAEDTIHNNADKAWIIMDDITYTKTWETPGIDNPIDEIKIIGRNHQIIFEQPVTSTRYAGLFGQITKGEIDSLNLKINVENSLIINSSEGDTNQATGGFAAIMENTTISRCHLAEGSSVTGSINVGGIAGKATNCTISGSSASGMIATNAHDGHVEKWVEKQGATEIPTNMGGVVGVLQNSKLTDSQSNAILESLDAYPVSSVGGLVGVSIGKNTIVSCRSKQSITIAGHSIGGIVGKADLSSSVNAVLTIDKTDFSGSLKPKISMSAISDYSEFIPVLDKPAAYFPSEAIGGLIGETTGFGTVTLSRNHVDTTINAYGQAGGYVGRLDTNAEIDGCLDYNLGVNACSGLSEAKVNLTAYRYAGGLIGVSTQQLNIQNIKQETKITNTKDVFCHDDCLYHGDPGYSYYLPNLHLFTYSAGGLIGAAFSGEVNVEWIEIQPTITFAYDAGGLIGNSTADNHISNISIPSGKQIQIFANKHAGGYIGSSNSTTTKISNNNIDNTIGVTFGAFEYCQPIYTKSNCSVSSACEHDYDVYEFAGYAGFCRDHEVEEPGYFLSVPTSNKEDCFRYCVRYSDANNFENNTSNSNVYFNGGGIVGESKNHFLQIEDLKLSVYNNISFKNAGILIGISENYVSILSNIELGSSEISGKYAGGVAGTIAGMSVINNLVLDDITILGTTNFGGVFGSMTGDVNATGLSISKTHIKGNSASSKTSAGGIIGSMTGNAKFDNILISEMIVKGTNASNTRAGGIIGYVDGNVEFNDLSISGSTVGNAMSVGGIFGFATGKSGFNKLLISDMTVKCNTLNGSKVGGIIGEVDDYDLLITNAVLLETIYGTYSGGVIGYGKNLSFEIDSILTNSLIKGTSSVGGVFGEISNNGQSGMLTHAGVLGTVVCNDLSVACGGLFGFIDDIYEFNPNPNKRADSYTLINIISNSENQNVGAVAGYLSFINGFLGGRARLILTKSRTYDLVPPESYYPPYDSMNNFGEIDGDEPKSDYFIPENLSRDAGSNIFSLTTNKYIGSSKKCVILVKGDIEEHDRCVSVTNPYADSIDEYKDAFCIKDTSVCPSID